MIDEGRNGTRHVCGGFPHLDCRQARRIHRHGCRGRTLAHLLVGRWDTAFLTRDEARCLARSFQGASLWWTREAGCHGTISLIITPAQRVNRRVNDRRRSAKRPTNAGIAPYATHTWTTTMIRTKAADRAPHHRTARQPSPSHACRQLWWLGSRRGARGWRCRLREGRYATALRLCSCDQGTQGLNTNLGLM